MTLRQHLGPDAERVHTQVEALLDSEDAVLVLVDGSRAITYAKGFGISPSHLELVSLDIERAVRSAAGRPAANRLSQGRADRERVPGAHDLRRPGRRDLGGPALRLVTRPSPRESAGSVAHYTAV